MMKKIIAAVLFSVLALNGFCQTNTYPATENPTIYNYSPMILLQRNTNEGGFLQGIQTRLQNGEDNWYFGALHSGNWIVSKGDHQNAKLIIESSGNVAIGTFDTRGYKFSVNGNIRAKEIKVENNNWPDYVFEPSYQLLDLDRLERFIKLNKHLPGVPSAKEVENNGANLGEMNAVLLKKIEELTLHVIELNKLVQQQQKALNTIQAKK